MKQTPWRRALALVAIGAVATVGLAAPASADSAPANPNDPATPVTVAMDALPTVQISGGTYNNRAGGVVWAQAVAGNTVYAGGDFTRARPAGAARGANEVTRTYLLAYDIRTGELLPFNHTLDGEVLSMAVSPDGQRLYVGGAFSKVDGKWRVNIAAFNTADGSLVETFQPVASTKVLALTASNTAVYAGGNFLKVGPKSGATLVDRSYLAGFSAADGSVLPFRADANNAVTSLALTQDGSRLVVGGRFSRLGSTMMAGLGSVNPTTGAALSFATNSYVKVGGSVSYIASLAVDGDSVYGGITAYGGVNTEGVFRASASTGQMDWFADCHGDTYSVFPMGNAVYAASHVHWCQNNGGFAETRNQVPDYYRANAYSKAATGRNTMMQIDYNSMVGHAAPSVLNWFPQFPAGTYTGIKQGPWHVTGNGTYLVYGGEFTQVNGVAQEGLARFAVPSVAPNKSGPMMTGTKTGANKWAAPTVRSLQAGQVTVTIPANYDYDNSNLTYRLYRGTEAGGPVAETKVSSTWWSRGTVTLTDTQAPPGTVQQYEVVAVDPFGNEARSTWVQVTVSGQVQQLKPGNSLATDAFERSATGGWGRATLGGGWQHDSKPAWYSVSGGKARISIGEAGRTQRAQLADVKQANVDVAVSVGLAGRPAVGTTRLWVGARTTADFRSGYLLRANVLPSGQVETVQLLKQVNGTQTTLAQVVPGVTLGDGEQLRLRLRVVGNQLQGKAWKVGTPEPAAWQLALSDSSVSAAGSVEVAGYTGASVTPLPVVVTFDDLTATAG
ncbi:MAG: hypothetical protein FWH11_12280 [Micrococcales bacterium]|nr:hypothetical protein [Micrococcales bacterium]